MSIKDYTIRVVVIDDKEFYRHDKGGMTPLSRLQASAARTLLGIEPPTIAHVPERSVELAKKANGQSMSYLQRPPGKGHLEMLVTIAQFNDPVAVAELVDLTGASLSVVKQRLSYLRGLGYVTVIDPDAHPWKYLATPEGSKLLVDSEKPS